jgi:predicted acyl esterase
MQMAEVRAVARRGVRGRIRARSALIGLLATALLAGACTDAPDIFGDPDSAVPPTEVAPLPAEVEDAALSVQPSVEQVAVTGADPGADLSLHDADGRSVATGRTDDQGSLIFRSVEPGSGYRVATVERSPEASPPFEVVAIGESTPEQSFYDAQVLEEGFTYITTRDGTTLSASVYLPGPPEEGPYPTVVEYSGYSPSKPATNLVADLWDGLSDSLPDGLEQEDVCELAPFACAAPDQPASMIAHALGYAVVGVNIRGTGCSGGAYDFFEPLQVLDGYDVIEAVAAQDWVKGNQVGMVGLSYPGISQLFVASSRPPSLAAITPLSVYDDTARGVLAPGGIFNEGFALEWADMVLDSAVPFGQGWERDRVRAGDATCERNQVLRGQNVDAVAKAQRYTYYEAEVADPLNPSLFVDDIEVPVFLGGSFQDEQTGGRFPLLFDDFDSAPVTRFSAWNGAHADGFAPANLVEWKTFLDFYVNEELTPRPGTFDVFAPIIMDEVFGASLALPPQRMFEEHGSFEAQRAAYEAELPIRILLESGAGDPDAPGAPVATTDLRFDSWPPAGTEAGFWYLADDGSLQRSEPGGGSALASRFDHDESLGSLRTVDGGSANDLFRADVEYDWRQEPEGSAAVFVSEPLEEDVVMIGPASADLWVRSSSDEADLGVTLSEVRPDGDETYVQSGVMRGSLRALSSESTDLWPVQVGTEEEAEPMPAGEFTEVRVGIFPFAHVFRAGSRIRMSVHTPGGDKTRWTYVLADQPEGTTIDVAHSPDMPSRLALPIVPGVRGYPASVPEDCRALRAQPCRPFEDYENRVVER